MIQQSSSALTPTISIMGRWKNVDAHRSLPGPGPAHPGAVRASSTRHLDAFRRDAHRAPPPASVPITAPPSAPDFLIASDLPGVPPEATETDAERTMLPVKAERRPL